MWLKTKGIVTDSRLFWRIAAGTFLSILIIELALLVFSWFSERERLFNRLDETLYTVTSLLDQNNPVPQLEQLILANSQHSKYTITGFVYESSSETSITGGTAVELRLANYPDKENPGRFEADTGTYVNLITLNSDESAPRKLWLQVDADWINEYMKDYVARIMGMVLLISLFVTGACLVFLQPILINPLLRLDKLLVLGQLSGIKKANATTADLRRTDELGRVFRSFDILRNQLISAEIQSTAITDRFEAFASLGADCFWEVDRRRRFTYVAGDVRKIFSLSPQQINGISCETLLSSFSGRITQSESLYADLIANGIWEGKIYTEATDDNKRALAVRIVGMAVKDTSGFIRGFRGTIKDISKETKLAEELTYQANHDELTRLCNRREFSNCLQQSLDHFQSSGQTFTLMMLDLDRFKLVNDTSGHAAGDAVLCTVASILKGLVADHDTVARLGGDEFAVLLRTSGIHEARQVAEKIRSTIENHHFTWDKYAHNISVSIGLAEAALHLSSRESITFAADSCCLEAKRGGKNQLRHYSHNESPDNVIDSESVWVSRIMHALDTDGFHLFRQSIVRIDKRFDEEHFEILLRMCDADGGYWAPDNFLPVAERCDLMPKIDRWVLENALAWLVKQDIPQDKGFCMNINLSATSLSNSRFRHYLLERVQSNGEFNRYICFEMTETAAMLNFRETAVLFQNLKEHGCSVALDDFGTGFSSLSHIRELPLDYIKIDGTFIREIFNNELDQAVVKSVSEIAKVLNIKTVAEFVDTENALRMLESFDIDYAQGYLFSRPVQLVYNDQQQVWSRAA